MKQMDDRKELGFAEALLFCTIRITAVTKDDQAVTGTGFFFEFPTVHGAVHAIITNRHVIQGTISGTLRFNTQNADGLPAVGSTYEVDISDGFENLWYPHPDENVDLCALPIAAAIRNAAKRNTKFFYTLMDPNSIISRENLSNLDAIDDVVMIGYPNGLWDEFNNLPIARKGVTATHPAYDFNGRAEFMIDAACFPGSSGSPVLLYKPGSTLRLKHDDLPRVGNILALLGVLYAGPQHTADGRVVFEGISREAIVKVYMPNNLGLVIKANELLAFSTYWH